MIDSLKQERIFVQIVACGIGNDADAAVRAIKAGAKEYIPLPPDAELIAAVLQAVSTDSHALIYRDPAMERIVRLAEQVAPSEASILVTGESGTGKEVLARYIHRKSKRAKSPFISVNCAAIPENLLESELFGHEKGAFTGAVARRIGKFEEANGGTLLLDEISDASPPPGQAAARHPGARDRSRRRHPADQGRYPPDRDFQPRPRSRGARRQFPRRPLFPPQRCQCPCPAAARAAARRRDAGRFLRQEIRRDECAAAAPPLAGFAREADPSCLARQCPRARKRHASRGALGPWRRDRAGRDRPAERQACRRGRQQRRRCPRGSRRPHRRRCRARSHPRDVAALPR